MATVSKSSWYGWRRDQPDARDRLYAAIARPPKHLPARVDLRPWCPAVECQGTIGSCTAHALTANLEFLARRSGRRLRHLSRLFVYYNARVLEGTAATDDGAMIRNGVKTLAKLGVCAETFWPYRIRRFARKPPTHCYVRAAEHQVTSYHRIRGLAEMRQCLAEGFPMQLGTVVGTVPLGRGRVIFSTLDIASNLGAPAGPADVARKLLCNFLAEAAR